MATPGDNHDDLISQFQGITGQDVDQSRFFLEAANWQLDVAMSSFYENEEPMAVDTDAGPPVAPQMMAGRTRAGGPAVAPPSGSTGATGSARIATLGTLSGARGGDSDDSEEEGQAFFAGGSDTSGQQILGPPRKKGEDLVKEMFKKARESGAEVVEPGSSAGPSAGAAFSGTAFKLGSSDASSEMVQASASGTRPEPPREFTLKMWQNGFSIDDGELRAYNDPQNRAFLAAVMTGRIPEELIREAKGGEVHVNMEDHKHEEYVKPKVKAKAFSGAGHTLGSVAPEVVGAGSIPAASTEPDQLAQNEAAAKEQVKVDPAQPITTIQVRMHDGSRIKIQLNQAHTVADLRRYIILSRPEIAAQTFILLTSYPSKELTEEGASLKDAGLLNSAILFKIK